MIYNQWYAIVESKEVPKGKVIGVIRLGQKIAIWRDLKGKITVLQDKCAHRGAALSIGKVCNDMIQCPFHGFEYDSTGSCQLIPANGRASPVSPQFKVNRYECVELHGFIWIWYGDKRETYPSIPFFEEMEGFVYSTFKDHWPVHYSRAIENQLDVIHLPFVHYNTIGRGHETLVNGPKTSFHDESIEFWYDNQKDDGSLPKKGEEIQSHSEIPLVKFKFPHIWRLAPFSLMRIFVAFVPIDEENTLLYLRTYQKIAKLPVLKQIVNFISMIGSKKVLSQDKRVVITQQPVKTEYKMGELLVQGDYPIVLYRKHRQELKEANVISKESK